jgi:hypothetical protein
MIAPAKTYEYRYIRHDARVYFIGRNLRGKFHHRMLYTEPFYSREQKVLRNSVIGFVSHDLATPRIERVIQDCELAEISIGDLKQMSIMLRMPLVVELDKHLQDDKEIISIYYFMPDNSLNKIKLY